MNFISPGILKLLAVTAHKATIRIVDEAESRKVTPAWLKWLHLSSTHLISVTIHRAELLVLQSKRREACDETVLHNHSSASKTSLLLNGQVLATPIDRDCPTR